MNEEAYKKQIAKLQKELSREKLTNRIGKIAGIAPTALPDLVERAMNRFDVNDDGDLRVKPLSATVSWETPESFVDGLRSTALHFFTDNQTSKSSGPSKSEIAAMSPEAKLAFANELTRPFGK